MVKIFVVLKSPGDTPFFGLHRYVRLKRVKGRVFRQFWSDIGHRFRPFWSGGYVEFCTLTLDWVCSFRRSYFFIIIDKTVNKSPSCFMFGWDGENRRVGKITDFDHK